MKNTDRRLLVIRNSAMGDVAMVAPVLRELTEQYPGVEIILLTRPVYHAFFSSLDGIRFFPADFNGRHRGAKGILFLFRDLKALGRIDYVVDLHDVLRSKALRILFRVHGIPSVKIDKGRREKRKVIKGLIKHGLQHTVERYRDVLARAGFSVSSTAGPWILPSPDGLKTALEIMGQKDVINAGVAPYSKHLLKIWPEDYMISLLKMITGKYKTRFWFFGGKDEQEKLELLASKVSGSVNLSGRFQLPEEIAFISRLDFMISMDSSNMHLAALTGTRVISIWGATDPVCGFGAWGQPAEHSVYLPASQLTCRPCTVFGKGECRRGDHACMRWLTPEMVFKKMELIGIFENL